MSDQSKPDPLEYACGLFDSVWHLTPGDEAAKFRAAIGAVYTDGRDDRAAELAKIFERIASSEHESFICTPPEYPAERATRAIRRDAFRRAAEIVKSGARQ